MKSGWNSVLTQHAVSDGRNFVLFQRESVWPWEHCGSIETAASPLQAKKKSLKCLLVILAVLQTGPFFVDILHVMPHMCGTLQHWIWEKRIGFEFLCDSTFYVFIVVNWEKSQSMENVWTDGFLCLGRKKVSIFVPSSLLVLSHKGKTGLYIFGIKKTDLFAAAI